MKYEFVEWLSINLVLAWLWIQALEIQVRGVLYVLFYFKSKLHDI